MNTIAKYRADLHNSGIYCGRAVKDFHGLKWMYRHDRGWGVITPQPLLWEDTVILPAGRTLVGLEMSSGEVRWKLDILDSACSSTPVIADGKVYCEGRQSLLCIDLRTRQKVWEFRPGPAVERFNSFTPICIAREAVLFGCRDHTGFFAVNVEDGRQIWWRKMPYGICSAPVVWKESVLFAAIDDGHRFVSLDLMTGDMKWSVRTGSNETSDPLVVADMVVYLGSNNLFCLRCSDGDEVWRVHAQEMQHSAPCRFNNLVYCGIWKSDLRSKDIQIYAVDVATGKEHVFPMNVPRNDYDNHLRHYHLWHCPTVICDGMCSITLDEDLHAFDVDTGLLQWSFSAGVRLYSSPIVDNGVAYLNTSVGCFAIS